MHTSSGAVALLIGQLVLSVVVTGCSYTSSLTAESPNLPSPTVVLVFGSETEFGNSEGTITPQRLQPGSVSMPTELEVPLPTAQPTSVTPTPTPGPAYRAPYNDDQIYADFQVDYLVFRYDRAQWTKDHVDFYVHFVGVLVFANDILHHQHIPGCVMGENVGRGLIGTGVTNASESRALGDRLLNVAKFEVDGVEEPYAVVEGLVAVEYPEQAEACWSAMDAVLETMSLKTP